jgi:hypothetical protein
MEWLRKIRRKDKRSPSWQARRFSLTASSRFGKPKATPGRLGWGLSPLRESAGTRSRQLLDDACKRSPATRHTFRFLDYRTGPLKRFCGFRSPTANANGRWSGRSPRLYSIVPGWRVRRIASGLFKEMVETLETVSVYRDSLTSHWFPVRTPKYETF